jgi:AraC-like DNA-binding protein
MDEAARQLRAHPRRSVAAVARTVGYTSRSHFSRQFKKHHGLAPSRWQREARR